MANYQDINNMTKSLQGKKKKTVYPCQEYILSPTPTAHLWISWGTFVVKKAMFVDGRDRKRNNKTFHIVLNNLYRSTRSRLKQV